MRHFLLAPAALLLASACASTTQGRGAEPTERVLVTDAQGQVIRQSALNDRATMTFAAPVPAVWAAVVGAYTDVGLEANFADQPHGQYGVRNFRFPRSLRGERIGNFLGCGSSLTGEVVDNAVVTADVITTVTAGDAGTTNGTVFVAAFARRNEGNSSGTVTCSSTGHLEEQLRAAIDKRLAAK
jgi:hypothetical protein